MQTELRRKKTPGVRRPPVWQDVARRFPSGKDCLASFIAYEAAEVLAGVKPANLVNIVNRANPCGFNLYGLFHRHGGEILQAWGLSSDVLRDGEGSLLVLLYDPRHLGELVEGRRARRFLAKAGYPEYGTWREALDVLRSRCEAGGGFPHEIGLFLGYPLKDVAGFLGWSPLPFTCQGPWRIYGDPRSSLALAESHRACRNRMIRHLTFAKNPETCVRRIRAQRLATFIREVTQ